VRKVSVNLTEESLASMRVAARRRHVSVSHAIRAAVELSVETLEPQALAETPEELHERGYSMGYADAILDAKRGALNEEILAKERRLRRGESDADMLRVTS